MDMPPDPNDQKPSNLSEETRKKLQQMAMKKKAVMNITDRVSPESQDWVRDSTSRSSLGSTVMLDSMQRNSDGLEGGMASRLTPIIGEHLESSTEKDPLSEKYGLEKHDPELTEVLRARRRDEITRYRRALLQMPHSAATQQLDALLEAGDLEGFNRAVDQFGINRGYLEQQAKLAEKKLARKQRAQGAHKKDFSGPKGPDQDKDGPAFMAF